MEEWADANHKFAVENMKTAEMFERTRLSLAAGEEERLRLKKIADAEELALLKKLQNEKLQAQMDYIAKSMALTDAAVARQHYVRGRSSVAWLSIPTPPSTAEEWVIRLGYTGEQADLFTRAFNFSNPHAVVLPTAGNESTQSDTLEALLGNKVDESSDVGNEIVGQN